MIQMFEISLVYGFFSYCEQLTINNTVFPLEHIVGLHYPASLAVRCGHVTETGQWDVGGRDVVLPTQSFTLSPFLSLPVDAEYPGERFRICILVRSSGNV